MATALKELGTLRLGQLTARLVEDPQGRKCIAIPIGDREVCFTLTQALLVREVLDQAVDIMGHYEPTVVIPEKEDQP